MAFITVFRGRERGSGDATEKFFAKIYPDVLKELRKFRNDKNLNPWAVFTVLMLHMNEDGWSWPSSEQIRDITTLAGENTLTSALKVLRNIRINDKRLLDHYRVRYPSGKWGASFYHLFPEEGGADKMPAKDLVLWNPQPQTTPLLTGDGSSAATPPLTTRGLRGDILTRTTNEPDRSGERPNSFKWKLVHVLPESRWYLNEEGDDKDALELKAAIGGAIDEVTRWVVLSSHAQPKPYEFYTGKFWEIKQATTLLYRTLVKAVAEKLVSNISHTESDSQFDLYRPDGTLVYSLINGKKPTVQRPPDLLLDAITQFCYKQAKTREEINALCERCVKAKKELLDYLSNKYPEVDKYEYALSAATKAIQENMPDWYEKNKLGGAGKPLNRPHPSKFLDTFLDYREWLIANPPKRTTDGAPKPRLVEYGVTADGRHIQITPDTDRSQLVDTYMVQEVSNG